MDRNAAYTLMTAHVADQGLRRHMLAVEAAMRSYAARLGGDVELWGLAGLLHDFDWEIHPTLEQHPAEGAPILRAAGCPETVVRAILSHNTAGTGVERESPIDFALLACDEVTGLLVRQRSGAPDKDIREVEIKSVQKRWKEKAFAPASTARTWRRPPPTSAAPASAAASTSGRTSATCCRRCRASPPSSTSTAGWCRRQAAPPAGPAAST